MRKPSGSRRVALALGTLVCAAGVIVILVLSSGGDGFLAGSSSKATGFYRGLEHHARICGLPRLADWASARREASRKADLEARVTRGDVIKLFVLGEGNPIDSQDFLPFFQSHGSDIHQVQGLDVYQFAGPVSESPSYVVYVNERAKATFESLFKASGIRVVSEPLRKSTAPFLLEHHMKGGSYTNARFDTVLFDVVQQRAPEARLAFFIAEYALASTPITIQLPAGLTMEETIARLCRAADCDFTVSAMWGETDLVTVMLERRGARRRLGIREQDHWPYKERVTVEPSHIHRPGCTCDFDGTADPDGILQR